MTRALVVAIVIAIGGGRFAVADSTPGNVRILSYGNNFGEVSPDGASIAYGARGGGLIVAAVQGGARTVPTRGQPSRLVWAPDSRGFAFYARDYESDQRGLYAYRVGDAQARLVATDASETELAYDARGQLMYLRSTAAGVELVRGSTVLAIRGVPSGARHVLYREHVVSVTGDALWSTPLATGAARRLASGVGEHAVSPVEDRACYVHDRTIRCVRFADGVDQPIAAAAGSCAPRLGERGFSPSGKLLAFADCRFGGSLVQIYDFDTELARPVATADDFQAFSLLDERTLLLHEHSTNYPEGRFGEMVHPAVAALVSVDLQTGERAIVVADHEQYQHIRPVRARGNVLVLSRTREKTDDLARVELAGAVVVPRLGPPPRDGTYTEWWGKGRPHVVAEYEDGALHGTRTVYYWNGRKREEGRYDRGVPDGDWTTYYVDGKRREVFPWRAGKLEGAVVTWYPNGVEAERIDHVANQAHGREVVWDERGRMVSEVGNVRGKREGLYVTWRDGKKASESTYKVGLLDGEHRAWDDQGRLTMQGRYAQGKQDGTWSSWWRGKPFFVRNYDHGVEHGDFTTWWDSGQVRQTGHHDHGSREGAYREYYADGRPMEEGEFRANRKHGVWRSWDRWTGKLTQQTYRDGVK